MTNKELERLIAEAKTRYESMTPEEQAAMWKAQRESWVRGEMGMGNDADETAYRERLRDGSNN